MKLTLIAVLFALLASVTQSVVAQNVYDDFVKEKYSRYSPNDHWNRGLIYNMQTGHAGLFSECDDELRKLHSPYISWGCRRDRSHNPLRNFLNDCNRRTQQFIDGAGNCVQGCCQSANCEPPIYQEEFTAQEQLISENANAASPADASRVPKTAITRTSPEKTKAVVNVARKR